MSEMRNRIYFPHLGGRIVKTTVAVFICLLIYIIRGYDNQSMPTEAVLTAIVCMQPFASDAGRYALDRFTSSLIGCAWGLIFLLTVYLIPQTRGSLILIYLLMSLGVLLSLYTTILIRKPETSSLAAIVFICMAISYPSMNEPLKEVGERLFDIGVGTVVAILVNIFRLPRKKNENYVFFLRLSDMIPDRFTKLSPGAVFSLNRLLDDGCRICLISEHAPAFFTLQMHGSLIGTPMIVMDGAAIFDADDNRFLWSRNIPSGTYALLEEKLAKSGTGYFIYTIHHEKLRIFHKGDLSPDEYKLMDRMRRSPYRDYLDGEVFDTSEVVYIKVIGKTEEIEDIHESITELLSKCGLRAAVRGQEGVVNCSGLYIYSDKADTKGAKDRLMRMLRKNSPYLEPVELTLPAGQHQEHDMMKLLKRVENIYEPVSLFSKK